MALSSSSPSPLGSAVASLLDSQQSWLDSTDFQLSSMPLPLMRVHVCQRWSHTATVPRCPWVASSHAVVGPCWTYPPHSWTAVHRTAAFLRSRPLQSAPTFVRPCPLRRLAHGTCLECWRHGAEGSNPLGVAMLCLLHGVMSQAQRCCAM